MKVIVCIHDADLRSSVTAGAEAAGYGVQVMEAGDEMPPGSSALVTDDK